VKTVLIASKLGDAHARSVKVALESLGVETVCWFGADFPHRDTISADISNQEALSTKLSAVEGFIVNSATAIWYRRCKLPSLSDDHCPISLNDDDRRYAEREIVAAYRGYWHLLANSGFWVNPLASSERCRHKMLQLNVAKQVGLLIPKTKISNSPEDIRKFLQAGFGKTFIYKPFYSAYWKLDEGGSARLPTTDISIEQLPSDGVLRLTPGIFQEKIDKKYEVRATFMGQSCVAIRINSQQNLEAKTDWRKADLGDLDIAIHELPVEIYDACVKMMRSLGIVFGCFDFIVTYDEDYVFLEVNEAGQFLWIEHLLPDVPLLDMMCQFLINGSSDFVYKSHQNTISYHDTIRTRKYRELTETEDAEHIKVPSIQSDIL
jgi:glutathione synthase/RimK-type ligase-like ATP-grasp enzyme